MGCLARPEDDIVQSQATLLNLSSVLYITYLMYLTWAHYISSPFLRLFGYIGERAGPKDGLARIKLELAMYLADEMVDEG